MDVILVRRLVWVAAEAAFRCACGTALDWNYSDLARCAACDRPAYRLLRSQATEDGDGREIIILARRVVESDRGAFIAQNFQLLTPTDDMLLADGSFNLPWGDLTNSDGLLK